MIISNEKELRKLYGWPKGRAKTKVLTELEKHSNHFINCSPFLVISTFNSKGRSDVSPRGGKPGFVKILDSNTLLIPDSKGNNRVDSLINIVETSSIGCLFFIPGIDESLRINGNAVISVKNEELELFSEMQNKPKSCLRISIQEVFLHCAKAFMRSKLWSPTYRVERPGFPTIGKMLNDQLQLNRKEESQEEMVKRYQNDL